MVYSGTHQALFIVSDEGVIVVDCPPSLDVNLIYAIGNVTDQPVRKVIYSHSHNDHIGSSSIFINNTLSNNSVPVDFIAHEQTKDLLEGLPVLDTGRPLPTETFTDELTVQLGNQTVELAYYGPNHQPGNIFIYVPCAKVLMLVDVIFPGWAPFFNLALAEYVPGYVEAHDIVLSYEFDAFVGGHFNRVGTRQDVEDAREYVNDLLESCRNALSDPFADLEAVIAAAALNPNNFYATGAVSGAIRNRLCAEPVLEKWLGRLAGVDVVVETHASTVIGALRVQYGEFNVVPFVNVNR